MMDKATSDQIAHVLIAAGYQKQKEPVVNYLQGETEIRRKKIAVDRWDDTINFTMFNDQGVMMKTYKLEEIETLFNDLGLECSYNNFGK